MITSYAPVFVSLCIISTFLVPLAKVIILVLRKTAVPGTMWFRLLDCCLPRILKPLSENDDECNIKDLVEKQKEKSEVAYFNASRLFIMLAKNLSLILTFGVVFPPLALAFAVNVIVILFSARLTLGRFIVNAIQQNKMQLVQIVEKECREIESIALLTSVC